MMGQPLLASTTNARDGAAIMTDRPVPQRIDRTDFRRFLSDEGIQTSVHHPQSTAFRCIYLG